MRLMIVLAAAGFLCGCSLRTMALRTTAQLLEAGSKTYDEESDPALARESLGAQLKMIEGLLVSDPGNERLLRLAAQGFGGYAFLFLEDSAPERAKTFYRRGRDYGLRLLAIRGLGAAGTLTGGDLEEALKKARRQDAPALFWAAYCWAGWVNLSRESAEALADLPKTAALMKRAHELDKDFYFAGTDLFFGVYLASRPKILGGDPEKAKTHFEAARRATQGKFLMAYVLEARHYAVAAQDRDHFKSLLAKVAESPSGSLPEARLADEVAKVKAAALMEKIDEFF